MRKICFNCSWYEDPDVDDDINTDDYLGEHLTGDGLNRGVCELKDKTVEEKDTCSYYKDEYECLKADYEDI